MATKVDYSKFPLVTDNHGLDNALKGATKSPGCLITSKWYEGESISAAGKFYPTYIKPIAAFLAYVDKKSVPKGVTSSYTITKKVGFQQEFGRTVEIEVSVSKGILGCDASLSVTTGFQYKSTITNETTESWTDTVTGPATYWVYQPVIVYATQVRATAETKSFLDLGKTKYVKKGDYFYFLAAVYRDSHTLSSKDLSPLNPLELQTYLLNGGWSRWFKKAPNKAEGYLLHQGSNKYLGPWNGETTSASPLVLRQGPLAAGDKMVMTSNGYLYHVGSGMFIVPGERPGDNTILVLFGGFSSEGSRSPEELAELKKQLAKDLQFQLTKEGYLYHPNSRKYVVTLLGESQDGAQIIMADTATESAAETFNKYKFTA